MEVKQKTEPVLLQNSVPVEETVRIQTVQAEARQNLYSGLLVRTKEEQKKQKSKKPVVDENQLSLFGFVA